jgi:hypothetical protein
MNYFVVYLHERSGRVAFPRTNVVPARPARETVGAVALAAERRADVRRSEVFMVLAIDVFSSIELQRQFVVLLYRWESIEEVAR